MTKTLLKITFAAVVALGAYSCKKNNLVIDQDIVAPAFAKFNTLNPQDTTSTYYILETNNTFKLPIGVTDVSTQDRVINLTYSSNAQQGVHYNAPTSVTIPAGETLDTLVISGIYSAYNGTRIDTLVIRIAGGDVPKSPYKSTYRLIMRKSCPVVVNDFLGDYDNTRELYGTAAYGPYTTSISSITSTGAKSARIVVENIWDYGWGPISFDMDWSNQNPSLWTVKVVPQAGGIGDAGTINSTYTGSEIQVRAHGTQVGTFNSCDQRVTLVFQLGVVGLGWFGSLYTVNMAR